MNNRFWFFRNEPLLSRVIRWLGFWIKRIANHPYFWALAITGLIVGGFWWRVK